MAKFLAYARHAIEERDVESVAAVLRSSSLTRGQTTAEFERAVAEYCGAAYAVAFNSGSVALRAACVAAKLCPHDTFLTTPNSFIATAACAAGYGVAPVFIDINLSGNIDLNGLEPNLYQRKSRGQKLVMAVHYGGIPVDIKALSRSVSSLNTTIIEDGAAALGSRYDARHRVGSCRWSDMTVFSFHPAKLITTGEGGMVTTNSELFAERLRAFRNNGLGHGQLAESLSSNYHLTDFQAALGLSQLKRIDAIIAKRKQVIQWYQSHLKKVPCRLLIELTSRLVAPHLAVILVDFAGLGITRESTIQYLFEKGIGTQVHYTPIYRHPAFHNQFKNLSPYFPCMEKFHSQALSLPLHSEVCEEDVVEVCRALKNFLK